MSEDDKSYFRHRAEQELEVAERAGSEITADIHRSLAARMLALLGVREVRLLTNNPAKVAALEAAGMHVAERVPHHLPANPHNERYLATKRDAAGHLLD